MDEDMQELVKVSSQLKLQARESAYSTSHADTGRVSQLQLYLRCSFQRRRTVEWNIAHQVFDLGLGGLIGVRRVWP